ncbi:MAG: hypothetical protein ABH851_03765 [Methanobacteriota archaeon]
MKIKFISGLCLISVLVLAGCISNQNSVTSKQTEKNSVVKESSTTSTIDTGVDVFQDGYHVKREFFDSLGIETIELKYEDLSRLFRTPTYRTTHIGPMKKTEISDFDFFIDIMEYKSVDEASKEFRTKTKSKKSYSTMHPGESDNIKSAEQFPDGEKAYWMIEGNKGGGRIDSLLFVLQDNIQIKVTCVEPCDYKKIGEMTKRLTEAIK